MIPNTNLSDNNWLIVFMTDPGKRIYRHILLVCFMTIIAFNSSFLTYWEYSKLTLAILNNLGLFILFLGIIYCNIYVLIPHLLLKDRTVAYIISLLLAAAFIVLVIFLGEYYLLQSYHYPPSRYSFFHKSRILTIEILGSVCMYTICTAGASVSVLFRHWNTSVSRMNELEQTNMKSEMEGLKNQVSPQFLSKTLNNAGNLATSDPEAASSVVMKLSRVLRYQLYDCSRNQVLLFAEITFLEKYLDIEKTGRHNFTFTISKSHIINVLIPPLLFIPFVEYFMGILPEEDKKSHLHLSFEVKGKDLHFTCIGDSSSPLHYSNSDSNDLDKVKRRLNLLYDNSYLLTIQKEETFCKINLQLKV